MTTCLRLRTEWLCIAVGFISVLPALMTVRESLWIDELHTRWTCIANWSDMVSRASAGNQSPLFFAIEKVCLDTVIAAAPEFDTIVLRMIPCASWLIMIAIIACLCMRFVKASRRCMILICIAAWLCLDRIGLFYAIEARPYAWVALASTCMMLVGSVDFRFFKTQKAAGRLDEHGAIAVNIHFAWIVFAWIAYYLHYTAGLAVLASWIGRTIIVGMEAGHDLKRFRILMSGLVVDGVLFLLGIVPSIVQVSRIALHRHQWMDFAGHASIWNTLHLMPVVPWCIVPCLGVMYSHYFLKRHSSNSVLPATNIGNNKDIPLIVQAFSVGMLPLLIIWLLTCLEVMPLMHRRYAIASYPGVLILGGWLVSRIPSAAGVWTVLLASIFVLVAEQGTWHVWKEGEWVGWQRGERWEQAIQWIATQEEKGDLIFVAPMLVETTTQDDMKRVGFDYATFPVTGSSSGRQLRTQPIPLSNNVDDWVPAIDRNLPQTAWRIWILARVSQEQGQRYVRRIHAQLPGPRNHLRVQSVEDFGMVQLFMLEAIRDTETEL